MTCATIPSRTSNRNLCAGFLGNILEHYDNALYSLLVPFLTPLFFTKLPYLTGLIVAYGIQVIGLAMRPLGALVFGYFGDRCGRKSVLSISILGMAITTVLMGCLPTYLEIGSFAPFLLIVLRGLQNFFASGESRGAAIFVLEHTHNSWRGFVSSLYDSSSILGVLLASALVSLLASFSLVEQYWRLLFLCGALTGFVGTFIRKYSDETFDFQNEKSAPSKVIPSLLKNRRAIVSMVLTSGFSYVTYSIPCILLNGFLPLISSITKAEALQLNTQLLVFDMLLLPLLGLATRWIPKETLMKTAAITLCFLAIPFFMLLNHPTMINAIIVRLGIVTIGVAFAAPFHQWLIELVPIKERYLVTSFGTSLGTQLIGAPCAAICLWLYKETGWVVAPAFYLVLAALGAIIALRPHKKLVRSPASSREH